MLNTSAIHYPRHNIYQGFDKKERNIPLTFYRLILDQLASCYNMIVRNNFQNTLITIAVDGTYNNN